MRRFFPDKSGVQQQERIMHNALCDRYRVRANAEVYQKPGRTRYNAKRGTAAWKTRNSEPATTE